MPRPEKHLQILEVRFRPTGIAAHVLRANALRGLFYTALRQYDAEYETELHNRYHDRPKPFSVAPLFSGGQLAGLRLGLMEKRLREKVYAAWFNEGKAPGHNQRRPYLTVFSADRRTAEVEVEVEALLAQEALTYQQLYEGDYDYAGVRLELLTPAIYKHSQATDPQGGRRLVAIEPHFIWKRYQLVWETMRLAYGAHTVGLPEGFLALVTDRVCLLREQMEVALVHGITTEHQPPRQRQDVEWAGLLGTLDYVWQAQDLPAERPYWQAWQALAAFAEFCGTGNDVTTGLGRTQRVGMFLKF